MKIEVDISNRILSTIAKRLDSLENSYKQLNKVTFGDQLTRLEENYFEVCSGIAHFQTCLEDLEKKILEKKAPTKQEYKTLIATVAKLSSDLASNTNFCIKQIEELRTDIYTGNVKRGK